MFLKLVVITHCCWLIPHSHAQGFSWQCNSSCNFHAIDHIVIFLWSPAPVRCENSLRVPLPKHLEGWIGFGKLCEANSLVFLSHYPSNSVWSSCLPESVPRTWDEHCLYSLVKTVSICSVVLWLQFSPFQGTFSKSGGWESLF